MVVQLPRHSLLPDLERSRAVLVGFGDGGALTGCLAEALTSTDAGRPYHPWRVRTLVDPADPAEVLDAVGRVAGEASDVLLFHYSGEGAGHERFLAAHGLDAVAESLSRGPAVRPVVILDCADLGAALSCFARDTLPWHDIRHPIALTLLAPTPGSDTAPASGAFTAILARAMTAGICGGPEVPELGDLQQAIEAEYLDHALSLTTESMAPEPGGAALRRGYKTPRLALSVNRSAARPYRYGALPFDIEAIHDYYWS